MVHFEAVQFLQQEIHGNPICFVSASDSDSSFFCFSKLAIWRLNLSDAATQRCDTLLQGWLSPWVWAVAPKMAPSYGDWTYVSHTGRAHTWWVMEVSNRNICSNKIHQQEIMPVGVDSVCSKGSQEYVGVIVFAA